MAGQPIQLEDGWNQLKTGGVQKIEQILEDMQDGVYQTKITTDEYSKLYTCAPHPPRVRRPLPPGDRAQEPDARRWDQRRTTHPRGALTAFLSRLCRWSSPRRCWQRQPPPLAFSSRSLPRAADHLRFGPALRSTVYTMCTQKPPNNWSEHLYNNYCDAVKDYLSARILPRIREKHDETMLKELVRRWENHKLMIRFLSHVFKYLDRFYVKRLSLPELADVGSQSFHEIVFNAVKRDVRTAILELIRREREGEMVDRELIKKVVVGIFVEMGGQRNTLEVYVQDFEEMLLSTTADFYSRESSKWAEEDSFPEYMCKAEDRLQQEAQRVSNYLHSSTEEKLLKVRQHQHQPYRRVSCALTTHACPLGCRRRCARSSCCRRQSSCCSRKRTRAVRRCCGTTRCARRRLSALRVAAGHALPLRGSPQ